MQKSAYRRIFQWHYYIFTIRYSIFNPHIPYLFFGAAFGAMGSTHGGMTSTVR